MLDEQELANGRHDGGQKLANEVVHAEFGDKQEHQQLAEGIADEVDNEKRKKPLPYLILDFEIEFPVQEETGDHGHLITDSVG